MIPNDTTVPIDRDEFETITGEDGDFIDLAGETTQGRVFQFLLQHADQAFRQRELVAAIDVPRGSVGPTLHRLEQRGLVVHRDRFWAVSDTEHAVAAAGNLTAVTADERDEGFTATDVETWMENAVDPIESLDNTESS